MNGDIDTGVGLELDQMVNENEKNIIHNNIFELIMRKSKNNNEYKKYVDIVGLLILSYNSRLGNMNLAEKVVYDLINESKSVNDLVMHYNVLKKDEKANADKNAENARKSIANMLLNDYKQRFGEGKKESYNILDG